MWLGPLKTSVHYIYLLLRRGNAAWFIKFSIYAVVPNSKSISSFVSRIKVLMLLLFNPSFIWCHRDFVSTVIDKLRISNQFSLKIKTSYKCIYLKHDKKNQFVICHESTVRYYLTAFYHCKIPVLQRP